MQDTPSLHHAPHSKAPNGDTVPEPGGGLGGGGPKLSSSPIETRTSYDVNVEFYGIVKIYNPVRENLLRAAAGLELKGGVEAEAAAPPAAATEANP